MIADLLEQDGYRTEYAVELARKYTAERDYETALMYASDHVSTGEDVTYWDSNLYLYLLAKNNRTDEAQQIVARLETLGLPDIDRFLGWYSERFDDGGADSSAYPPMDSPLVVNSDE